MKLLYAFTFVALIFSSVTAQQCDALNMIQEGSKWELTSYNKRDKVTGSTYYHITSVSSEGDAVVWTLDMEMKDEDGEVFSTSQTEIRCEAGVFKMSMEQFMNSEQFQGMEEMDVEVDASELEYPTVPKVGEKLPDAKMTIKAGMNGMTMMTMITEITDRKITSEETIETPAGTFDCLVLEQTTTVGNKLIDKDYPTKDWYLPGFGVVRSETYKSNGKLNGYTQLTMYEQ